MVKIASLILVIAILLTAVPEAQAAANLVINPADEAQCSALFGFYNPFGPLSDGSNYCFWPSQNGDMVIFAHGYVDPAIVNGAIPFDQIKLPDPNDPTKSIYLPAVLASMKYGFAIVSYPKNGLAVKEGVSAVEELAGILKKIPTNHIYLVGASEGGLVTALAIEQNPNKIFAGGVTTCGPIGDFQKQIDYWGDFRVAFDYFFSKPGLAPFLQNSAVDINDATLAAWKADPSLLQGQIVAALKDPKNVLAVKNLLAVSKAPFDPMDSTTIGATVLGLLDYNIKATNEARTELSTTANLLAQPFDNTGRWYFGSSNDLALNRQIARFKASAGVGVELKKYQTSGMIQAPLVALHTTGDPIVPFWHEILYQFKIWKNKSSANFISLPVIRYGHCAFTAKEAIFAFSLMVFKATGSLPALTAVGLAPQSKNDVLTLQDYNEMAQQYQNALQPFEPKNFYLPMVTQ